MRQPEPHPDTLLHQHQVKQITRGGRQAADDKAMEAYWLALESGKSKEEANKIFSQTYIKVLHGTNTTSLEVNKRRLA